MGWLTALILALSVVMAIESLFAPDPLAQEQADAVVDAHPDKEHPLSSVGNEASTPDRDNASAVSAPAQAALEPTFPASSASPAVSTPKRLRIPPFVPRLVTVRYALLACWIALVVAQPAILGNLPILFTVLVIAVALGAGLVPLARRRSAVESAWS